MYLPKPLRRLFTSFGYTCTIGDHIVSVLQNKKGFDLRIDNVAFEQLNYMSHFNDLKEQIQEIKGDEPKNKESKFSEPIDERKETNLQPKKELPGIFANKKKSVPKETEVTKQKAANELLVFDFDDSNKSKANPKPEREDLLEPSKPVNLLEDFDF
eukprot:TRINITY_DN9595_c0_g1_i2.p1 TRINITY_DN9595_c0_g1~~TRINITY_DN9595_c0_g1_i2.p1  ORF type:complete len:156 (-),score=30.75 TRINITY_DN9595_c0_g1_i2:135-602(-)